MALAIPGRLALCRLKGGEFSVVRQHRAGPSLEASPQRPGRRSWRGHGNSCGDRWRVVADNLTEEATELSVSDHHGEGRRRGLCGGREESKLQLIWPRL